MTGEILEQWRKTHKVMTPLQLKLIPPEGYEYCWIEKIKLCPRGSVISNKLEPIGPLQLPGTRWKSVPDNRHPELVQYWTFSTFTPNSDVPAVEHYEYKGLILCERSISNRIAEQDEYNKKLASFKASVMHEEKPLGHQIKVILTLGETINEHLGPSFDELLEEEGLKAEVEAVASKKCNMRLYMEFKAPCGIKGANSKFLSEILALRDNMDKIFRMCGLVNAHPIDHLNGKSGEQITPLITRALQDIRKNQEEYKKIEPESGRDTYERCAALLNEVLQIALKNPTYVLEVF